MRGTPTAAGSVGPTSSPERQRPGLAVGVDELRSLQRGERCKPTFGPSRRAGLPSRTRPLGVWVPHPMGGAPGYVECLASVELALHARDLDRQSPVEYFEVF